MSDDIIKRLRFVKHTADWEACDEAAARLDKAERENERLRSESKAQLEELGRIDDALGTNEGPSAVDHIMILKAENELLRESIGVAYGYLWCVNNEPGTPFQYPPEKAAYEARAVLRDTMTSEQRGTYINRVVALVRGKRHMPLPSTAIDAARREK